MTDKHARQLAIPKIRLYGGPYNGQVLANVIPEGPSIEVAGLTYEIRTTEFGLEGHFLFG